VENKSKRIIPARGNADILDNLRNLMPELHAAEQQVAKLVLTEPAWVAENAIKTLANRTKVSEPTVMRLCRKLGLRGFSDFKRKLTEDLVVSKLYLEADAVAKESSPNSIVESMVAAANQSLRECAGGINSAALDAAANMLVEADMIYSFGIGGSSATLAEEFENRLFRLGKKVQATSDPYRHLMTASIATKNDVIVFVSSTGRPKSLVESAELSRKNNAKVVSITTDGSPLAEQSDVVVAVDMFDDETFFNLPSRTRYAQLLTVDCLAASVAAKLKQAPQNLKAIRTTLCIKHGITKFQPIGD